MLNLKFPSRFSTTALLVPVLSGGLFFAVSCFPVTAAETTATVVQAEAGARTVKTANYEATVDKQGALPSFKIGGQEFLKAEAGIPHGLYLYQDGPVWLTELEQPQPNTVVAKGEKGTLRYEFAPDSVKITAENTSDKNLTYYMVFDTAVNTLISNQGNVLRGFVNQGGQRTTTWFAGKNKLKVEGGNGLFGPWNDRYQVWSADIAPKATGTFTLTAGQATAEELAKIADAADKPAPGADVAAPKYGNDGNISADFLRTHEQYLQRIKEGPIGLLFIGDSITNRWRGVNDLWTERFGKYQPANFGIEGDRTEHVLWRFDNGELTGIAPKVVVVMIGTNNMGSPAEEIVRGDTKVVSEIHRRLPNTKVLLLGIFPRGAQPTDGVRAKIKTINAQLAKLDDGNKTRFLDIGNNFLEADGTLTAEMAPDALHISPKGYKIWADSIQSLLEEMMK